MKNINLKKEIISLINYILAGIFVLLAISITIHFAVEFVFWKSLPFNWILIRILVIAGMCIGVACYAENYYE